MNNAIPPGFDTLFPKYGNPPTRGSVLSPFSFTEAVALRTNGDLPHGGAHGHHPMMLLAAACASSPYTAAVHHTIPNQPGRVAIAVSNGFRSTNGNDVQKIRNFCQAFINETPYSEIDKRRVATLLRERGYYLTNIEDDAIVNDFTDRVQTIQEQLQPQDCILLFRDGRAQEYKQITMQADLQIHASTISGNAHVEAAAMSLLHDNGTTPLQGTFEVGLAKTPGKDSAGADVFCCIGCSTEVEVLRNENADIKVPGTSENNFPGGPYTPSPLMTLNLNRLVQYLQKITEHMQAKLDRTDAQHIHRVAATTAHAALQGVYETLLTPNPTMMTNDLASIITMAQHSTSAMVTENQLGT
jgi:hypothetical protein